MASRVRTLYKIKPRPEAPRQARHIIAEELSARLPPDQLHDLKLMVSELVTNGIVHGRQGADEHPVMLDLCVNGGIRCAVLDRGPGFAARVGQAQRGGWGLRLIEALADRWGMQCSPQLTEVWFERASS
jgi:two-component sensor histidine kinase